MRLRAPNWVQEDRIRSRMNILAASLAKTDRILTGRRDITVSMKTTKETGVPSPGFSDGQNIVIHRDRFQNIGDAITLVKIMGLNYHELSHIMMTPRNNTKLKLAIMRENLGYAFNALEDQRIETHFVATYQASAKYFTEMVIEFYVNNQQFWPLAHLLTYGRRFLPREIREALKDRFVLSGTADEKRAEEIIDEYRLLDLTDVDRNMSMITRILSLVREYHKILMRAQTASGQQLPNPFGASDDGSQGCGSQKVGEPDGQSAREANKRAVEKAEQQDEVEEEGEDGSGFWDDVEEEDDDDESASEEEDGDEEDSGDWEDNKGSEDDGASTDDDSDDDGDEDEDDSSSDAGGSGSSSGSDDDEESSDSNSNGDGDAEDEPTDSEVGNSNSNQHGNGGPPSTDEELEDIMNDILRGVLNSEQVKGDIRQMQNSINDPDAFDLDDRVRPHSLIPAQPDWIVASNNVERELRRLFAEVEPGWKYGSDTGRLNVNRAMSSDDYEDVFDEWDEGRETDTGIEAVFAIDTSGSMGGQEIVDACVSFWIIKRALDAVGATVSVVSFDVVTKTLFGRHDKVEKNQVPYYVADGADTCPAQAIRNARRILSQSEKPNKVFFIHTDGGWSRSNPEAKSLGYSQTIQEDIPTLVKTIPATTVFVGIGYGGASNQFKNLFDIAANVDHANHIAPLIRTVVTNMLRNAVSRVGQR